MKNLTLLTVLLIFVFSYAFKSLAQDKEFSADWESIDSRPVAEWFSDAKFGIFIHWGPYSVPAWTPKGTYSEWYQYWLQNETLFGNGKFTGKEVVDFHNKTYGKDFSYYEFGPMFKADLFNPEEWAELFKNAGAKLYIPLKVSAAFHSRYMEPARKEFEEFLDGFEFSDLRIPVISNVEARPYLKNRIKKLLADQITHSVKWTESIQYLMGRNIQEFKETGGRKK